MDARGAIYLRADTAETSKRESDKLSRSYLHINKITILVHLAPRDPWKTNFDLTGTSGIELRSPNLKSDRKCCGTFKLISWMLGNLIVTAIRSILMNPIPKHDRSHMNSRKLRCQLQRDLRCVKHIPRAQLAEEMYACRSLAVGPSHTWTHVTGELDLRSRRGQLRDRTF